MRCFLASSRLNWHGTDVVGGFPNQGTIYRLHGAKNGLSDRFIQEYVRH